MPGKIDRIICDLRRTYEESPYEINNGNCEEFAEDLARLLPGATTHWSDELTMEDENDSAHKFVKFQDKYYDAECPMGVVDWRQLPACRIPAGIFNLSAK